MARKLTYDPKVYDLALNFLRDHVILRQNSTYEVRLAYHADNLAQEIQRTIDEFMEQEYPHTFDRIRAELAEGWEDLAKRK